MKIRITAGGIFGADGEIPVGTEMTVSEEPKGWEGRYVVVGDSAGKEPVTNPADPDKMTVEELKALLTERGVSFPDDAKKADLLALAKK